MKLFLGIDGGQSSTTAVIGDETGRVLGSGSGGPCNHVQGPEGKPKFVNAIQGCVQTACKSAGVEPSFEVVCGGFSGGPADKADLLQAIVKGEVFEVTNDAVIALAGATGGQPGLVVIAGTGSIALGRNAQRRTARAGGWGYIFGDEGGGFDLTRQALRAILRHEEGWGPATALTNALLSTTGAATANDLLHSFYTTDYNRPRIAGFSQLVNEAAAGGDVVARGILTGAAQQLALYAAAVRHQLFAPGESVHTAFIGGVFQSEIVLDRFRTLVEMEEGCRVIAPLHSPAIGALLEAYAKVGIGATLSGILNLEKLAFTEPRA